MTSNRIMRLIATLIAFTVGMLVGAHVSWALTALVCVALGLAIVFSVALVRMEEDRDRWQATANLKNLEPWQVQFLDHVMDPRVAGPRRLITPMQHGSSEYDGSRFLSSQLWEAALDREAQRPPDRFTLRKPRRLCDPQEDLMATEPHYKIIRTNAGWHVTTVAGNAELTLSGQVLTSEGAALKCIESVARMHSPCEHATIDPRKDKVWVYQYPQAIVVTSMDGKARDPEGVHPVPIRYSDERRPRLLARAAAAVGRSIIGTPSDVQARAEVGRSHG